MKVIFCLFLNMFFLLCQAFSWDISFKNYKDSKNGYAGRVCIDYMGIQKGDYTFFYLEEKIENATRRENIDMIVRRIGKLTNEESFLLNEALGEYDVKKNEIYSVLIFPNSAPKGTSIMIYLVIEDVEKDGSYTYEWSGFSSKSLF